MGFSMNKLFASIFLVMVLLATNTGNMGPAGVEGRTCTKPSKFFTGPCLFKDRNCPRACKKEGLTGSCDGSGRCVCDKPC